MEAVPPQEIERLSAFWGWALEVLLMAFPYFGYFFSPGSIATLLE
jgi:hypothetical protein